jgi:hypothetical protein
MGFRVFKEVPGSLAAAGKPGPRSAVVGFASDAPKVGASTHSEMTRTALCSSEPLGSRLEA